MGLIPCCYPCVFSFLRRANITPAAAGGPLSSSLHLSFNGNYFIFFPFQNKDCPRSALYRIQNWKCTSKPDFPLWAGKSGVQRTLSSYWIYSNLLLSFSLYTQIPFSPLYQRMSGILMSFNVGYGISGNSFISLFNVIHPSKIRLFFINSPGSAVVALINTP